MVITISDQGINVNFLVGECTHKELMDVMLQITSKYFYSNIDELETVYEETMRPDNLFTSEEEAYEILKGGTQEEIQAAIDRLVQAEWYTCAAKLQKLLK